VQALADVAAAVAQAKGVPAPAQGQAHEAAQAAAQALLAGERKAVLLGNAAAQHPQASALLALAQWIAAQTGASFGYFGEGGNAVGAQLVGAMPGPGGLNAGQMLSQPMKALLLLNVEPTLDAADAAAAKAALANSGLVVAMSPFKDAAAEFADVMLPVAPFTETAGTLVSAEGRVQSFHGVVKPLGETRPAWKVLRVLGNLLGLDGFSQESAEDVRAEALGDVSALAGRLDNATSAAVVPTPAPQGLQRIADVPIYQTDPMVRRSPSLQLTADANRPLVALPAALWQRLGLGAAPARVVIGQGQGAAVLAAVPDATLAADTVRIAAGHPATAPLGAMFGTVTVDRVEGA
jgi:NADH-quinone oxidoreductase subunit G